MTDPRNFSSEFAKVHGPNWAKWGAHLVNTPAVGLELGTWLGEGSEWALDNLFTHPESRFITVDTHQGSAEHHLAGIDCTNNESEARARLARFGERVSIVKGLTHEFLKHYCYPVDFVYVDASHDAMNVLRDSVLVFDLLKVGGTIIWDDMNWGIFKDEIDRPKIAIEAVLKCYSRQLEIVSLGDQVCARKVA